MYCYEIMYRFLKHLVVAACITLILVGGTVSINAAPPGFLEGHLKIFSIKEVELAGDNVPTKATAQNYDEYPLVILSRDGKTEVARLTADGNGNYRVALPPGDYLLDVQDRARKHVRAKPQSFTVGSNQTLRVDMDMDTGIR